ncbi:uncharacterized protein [Onthophagus taurus]|uniref:uncharacterized protein n=1 Tax=Onthophagus taurus TaxID=166361 RepID=UPI0039BE16F6
MEFLSQPHPMKMDGDIAVNWNSFKDNFETYALATGCANKEKAVCAAAFLHCMGQEARDVLKTLEVSTEDKKDKEKIIRKLDAYFIPQRNKTVERHKFNSRIQIMGELFDSFLADLRKLVVNCDYGNLKDDLIADRIVCGIVDNRVKDRLLRETDLTLKTAIEICKAAELTEVHIKNLEENSTQVGEIKKIHQSSRNSSSDTNTRGKNNNKNDNRKQGSRSTGGWKQNKEEKTCKRCGYKHEKKCPAYGQICKKCEKPNHFARCCRSNDKSIHGIEQKVDEDNKEKDDGNEVVLYSLTRNSLTGNDWYQELYLININKTIKFKLDTGAHINVIPEYMFKMFKIDQYLEDCKFIVKNYGGATLKVKGSCILTVELNSKRYKIKFIVIETNNKTEPLLGIATKSFNTDIKQYFIEHYCKTIAGM